MSGSYSYIGADDLTYQVEQFKVLIIITLLYLFIVTYDKRYRCEFVFI